MGKGSAQIQRDIERHRDALSRRIEELDRRVREDIEKTRSEAQNQLQSMTGRAKDQAGKAKDRASGVRGRVASLNDRVEESPIGQHPNLLLAGSFAAGIAIGMATGGGGGRDVPREEPEEPPAWFRNYETRRAAFAPGQPGRLDRSIDSMVSGLRGELLAMFRDIVDRAMHRSGEEGEDASERFPAFLRSAWDNISSRIEPERPKRPVGARSASKQAEPLVEVQDRDLPADRPLSDLEQRTAEDLGVER